MQPITPEEAAEKMRAARSDEEDDGHRDCDAVLCEVLQSLGYGEAVSLWHEQDKWYA